MFLRGAEGRVVGVDARPSDAIALALGNRVPIFVSKAVVAEAAIPWDKLKSMPGADAPQPMEEGGTSL